VGNTYVVNTTADLTGVGDCLHPVAGGLCGFRQAVDQYNLDRALSPFQFFIDRGDQITFSTTVVNVQGAVQGGDPIYNIGPNGNVVFDNPDGVPVTVTGNGQGVTFIEGGGTAAGLAIECFSLINFCAKASESSVTLSDLTVADMSNGGGYASAIDNASELTINDSTVEDNTRGGITNEYGSGTFGLGGFGSEGGTGSSQLTINDSTVNDNTNDATQNSNGNGGGIDNEGSTVTINDSTVNYNTATYGGGIYNAVYGHLFITDSAINYNTAGGDGGGIYNDGIAIGDPSSTVEGNIAGGHGGGVYNQAFGGPVGVGGPPNPGGLFGGLFGPGPVVTGNVPDNVYKGPAP
jgi:hypothetical protein